MITEIELLKGVPKVNIDVVNDVDNLKKRLAATEETNKKILQRFGIK